MPELPEVETIRRGLEAALKGAEISDVDVAWAGSMPAAESAIAEQVKGRKIESIRRRGKVMIMDLNSGFSLLVHLKMTGQLVFEAAVSDSSNKVRVGGGHPTDSLKGELPDNSTRVEFLFADGSRLFFNDQRKFGWIKLVKSSEVDNLELLASMGPEPLGEEFALTGFIERLQKTRRVVKAAILDQRVVAGVGNIYADEALHLAKIHPSKPANQLREVEIRLLYAAIKQVMNDSLELGGTSFTNYVNAEGLKGDYLDNARVFKREGLPCPECAAAIEKIRVAGRGTHICPKCQRL